MGLLTQTNFATALAGLLVPLSRVAQREAWMTGGDRGLKPPRTGDPSLGRGDGAACIDRSRRFGPTSPFVGPAPPIRGWKTSQPAQIDCQRKGSASRRSLFAGAPNAFSRSTNRACRTDATTQRNQKLICDRPGRDRPQRNRRDRILEELAGKPLLNCLYLCATLILSLLQNAARRM